jgi:hypothetical protein
VLVYAGELDANPAPETACARLFPNTTVTISPAPRTSCGSTIRPSLPPRSPHSWAEWRRQRSQYYSPGLLHDGPFLPAGLGDAGGLELGAVVVPSGAGLVASRPGGGVGVPRGADLDQAEVSPGGLPVQ